MCCGSVGVKVKEGPKMNVLSVCVRQTYYLSATHTHRLTDRPGHVRQPRNVCGEKNIDLSNGLTDLGMD